MIKRGNCGKRTTVIKWGYILRVALRRIGAGKGVYGKDQGEDQGKDLRRIKTGGVL